MNGNVFNIFALVSVGSIALAGCGDSAGAGGAGGAATTTTTGTGTTTSTTTSSSTKSSSGSGTTTSTSGTTSGSNSSSSTGAGACAVPNDTKDTCEHACAAVYDCGALVCTGTDQECTGFAPQGNLTKVQFTSSCTPQCAAQMTAFLAVVDPTDCAATITNLKAGSTAFAAVCTP